MFVRGIVHRHDQLPLLAGDPSMPTAVLVPHHPRQRRTLSPSTVHPPFGRLGHQPRRLQRVAAGSAIPPIPGTKVPHLPAQMPALVTSGPSAEPVSCQRPALQRCGGGIQHQGKTDHQKSLRLSNPSCAGSRLVSHIWRFTRTGVRPQILLKSLSFIQPPGGPPWPWLSSIRDRGPPVWILPFVG